MKRLFSSEIRSFSHARYILTQFLQHRLLIHFGIFLLHLRMLFGVRLLLCCVLKNKSDYLKHEGRAKVAFSRSKLQ